MRRVCATRTSEAARHAGVVEHALRGRGLAGVNVGDDANIANGGQRRLARSNGRRQRSQLVAMWQAEPVRFQDRRARPAGPDAGRHDSSRRQGSSEIGGPNHTRPAARPYDLCSSCVRRSLCSLAAARAHRRRLNALGHHCLHHRLLHAA